VRYVGEEMAKGIGASGIVFPGTFGQTDIQVFVGKRSPT
jgi:hypothetical protein